MSQINYIQGNSATFGIASQSIGANSFVNWTPPRKQYAFNEESMLLQDYSAGLTYKVVYWAAWTEMAAMRECYRFEVEDRTRGCRILMVPEAAVEAYLKPGSRRPKSDAEYYLYEPAGHPVQAGKTPPTSKEDDMLRKDFTFDYTGTEIAKAIDGKIAEIKAKIKAATKHDLDALVDAGLIDGMKRAGVEATVKGHEDRIKTWEKEKRPYAKAATKKFSLDSEDVEHFGL